MVYNISQADNMHPISLYFVDTQEIFSPDLIPDDVHYRLISQNPVSGAQFFHFMVEIFIKHVLGVGQDHPGYMVKLLHIIVLLSGKEY